METNFIEQACLSMVESKNIETRSLLPRLKKFEDSLLKKRQALLKIVDGDTAKIFPSFHSIETERRIVNSFRKRLPKAKRAGDNPTVAEDMLSIMPEFNMLHQAVKEGSSPLLMLATKLQAKAMRHQLYPSKNEIIGKIDRRSLTSNISDFIEKVGDTLEEI